MWHDFDSTPQDEYEWLLNVTIITSVLQRTIFDVSFISFSRKPQKIPKQFSFASITG